MLAHIRTVWRHTLAAASQEHCLVGASLFRIGAGLTILAQYFNTYTLRHLLYGPDGLVPYEWFVQELRRLGSFSLYALDPSPLLFESIFHLGMVVTLLWVLGWHTRLMTLLTWVFLWSLHARNPTLWDGGDNLVRIVLLYTCFANLGAICSVDCIRGRLPHRGEQIAAPVRALLHNTAVLAIALQLCLVYGSAGLAKVEGTLWQNGTALYYILRVGEFSWTGYAARLYQQSILVTALTYGTVAFQVSFPFLFFLHRATRRLALALAISFHLGIALVLGLHTFAAFLISIDLLLLPDRDYRAAVRACRRWWRSLVACWEEERCGPDEGSAAMAGGGRGRRVRQIYRERPSHLRRPVGYRRRT